MWSIWPSIRGQFHQLLVILIRILSADQDSNFAAGPLDEFTILFLLNRRLPIDVNNCSATELVRVRHLRTPRGKADKDKDFISGVSFDPRKYIKKKKK